MTDNKIAGPNKALSKDDRTPQTWRMFVDGEWLPGDGDVTHQVLNPADNQVVALVPAAGPGMVDRAVQAARRSFDQGTWRLRAPATRADILIKLATLLDEQSEALALTETLNNGMPLRESRGMVKRCVQSVRYAAGLAQRAFGESIPVAAQYLDFTVREPVGVCAMIVPWNGPLISALWKIGPAIALGNSVVLKPSELTPLTALLLADLCVQAGIPPGVVNVVVGDGSVGAQLAAHPAVDKVAITGSTQTGIKVMQSAAVNLKRVTLELGGKSPHIFFADTDVESAVAAAMTGLYRNCGQVCVAGSRLIVQRALHDRFVERLVEETAKVRVGSGLDRATQVGPLISRRQLARVKDYVALGKAEGANLLIGGDGFDDGPLAAGNFIRPAVFANASNDMRISREEIFGPVGVVIPFDDEDEAIAIGNDTDYGLAAGVWTRDVGRALRAGTVWVNTFGWNFVESPMGGFKRSGIGRENGDAVIAAYTEIKNVVIDITDGQPPDMFGVCARQD